MNNSQFYRTRYLFHETGRGSMNTLSLRRHRMTHLSIVVIPIALLLWSRFGAPTLLSTSYQSYTQYEGIYRAGGTPGPSDDAIVEQVVIFVVDGLRVDESRELPALNRLRALGAQRVLQVGQPSLSYPGWTTISTGAWPEQSGVSSNDIERAVELDTIFAAARRRDLDTAIVGTDGWRTLFDTEKVELNILSQPEYNSLGDVLALDERLAEEAREVLIREPHLVLIHLLGVDNAGHGFGGASAEYAEVAVAADRLISDMMALIDLSTSTVLVTSDHGHIDSGGHGGYERVVRRVPLVAVGKGIKPGIYRDAMLVDIAPTVAVLLGMEIPAHNQGVALLDQIDVPAAFSAQRGLHVAEQLSGRHGAMLLAIDSPTQIKTVILQRVQDALAGGDYADAANLTRASVYQARTEWRTQRQARLMREQVSRVPTLLLLLVPFGLYGGCWRHAGWSFRTPMLGMLMFFGLWHVMFRAHGYSFSASWLSPDPMLFVQPRVLDALLVLIVVMSVIGTLRRRFGSADVALTAVHTLFLIGTGMFVQIAAFYLAWDVVYHWYLPDLGAGVKYYMDVALSTVFWPYPALPLAVLLPLLAVLVARIAPVLERWRYPS